MNDHSQLQTERLRLEPLARGHAQSLFEVLSDHEAVRFWHAPPHRSIEETLSYLDGLIAGRARAWAIVRRERPDAVGLVYYLSDTAPVGMGYILRPDLWGRGIAREATQKVLEHGFEVLGFDRVELWIESENARSLALANRLGFVRRGSFRAKYSHRVRAHELVVFGLYASEDRTHPRAVPDQFYSCVPLLSVPNLTQSVDFYRELLGFEVEFIHGDPPSVARVHRSDWSASGTRVQFQASNGPNGLTGVTLYFEVGAGIDGLFDELRARGVVMERAPQTMPWGRREFSSRDCNGVLLRFSTPA